MIILIHEGSRTWSDAEVADLDVPPAAFPERAIQDVLESRRYRIMSCIVGPGRVEFRVAERSTASRFVELPDLDGDTQPFGRFEPEDAVVVDVDLGGEQ